MVTKVNTTVINGINSNVSLANNASFLGGIPAASYALTTAWQANAAVQAGAIASKANLTDILYVGTTSIALNRTSASQTLTGVDISGSATTAVSATALSTASGLAPSYSARAWVNFNGTGTVAIRANGNVSSITDVGTGQYLVNFATEMPDIIYACVGSCATLAGRNGMTVQITRQQNTTVQNTTAAQRIWVVDDAGNNGDVEFISLAFFR